MSREVIAASLLDRCSHYSARLACLPLNVSASRPLRVCIIITVFGRNVFTEICLIPVVKLV